MSLVALVIRKTLKRALLDKTLAGARIYDSNIAPLDDLMVDNTAPTITVATDEQTGTFPALSYMNAERELTLVIEMAVAKAVRVEAEAEGEEDAEDVILPQTDEALEMTLDLMNRQIMFVMQAGPDPWSDLFRTFVGKPVKFASRRGAGWENGPRFAARQLIITYSPLHEPGFGKDPTRAWAALIAAMEADESRSSTWRR